MKFTILGIALLMAALMSATPDLCAAVDIPMTSTLSTSDSGVSVQLAGGGFRRYGGYHGGYGGFGGYAGYGGYGGFNYYPRYYGSSSGYLNYYPYWNNTYNWGYVRPYSSCGAPW
jgi:hypothetical protein